MKLILVVVLSILTASSIGQDRADEERSLQTSSDNELQELKVLLLSENGQLRNEINRVRGDLELEVKLRKALEKKLGISRVEIGKDTKQDSLAAIYLSSKILKIEGNVRTIFLKLEEIISNNGDGDVEDIKKSLQNLVDEFASEKTKTERLRTDLNTISKTLTDGNVKTSTAEARSKSNFDAIGRLETKVNECDQDLGTLRNSVKDVEEEMDKVCSKSCSSTNPQPASGSSGNSTIGTEGREFILAFMKNYKPNLPISLRIGARSSGTVTIEAPGISYSKSYTVSKGFIEIAMPTSLEYSGTGIGSNGVSVRSTTDVTVIAEAHGQGAYITNDNALVFPTNMLSREYFVASYTQLIQTGQFSQLIVVAVHSSTTIQLLLRTGPVVYGGRAYRPGDVITATIGALQTFQIQHTVDLTGTFITSNKPVAVFSGSTCTFVPQAVKGCDELYEQMLPTKFLTRSYVVPPVLPRAGYVVRIIVTQDGTNIQTSVGTKNGLNRGQSLTATMGSKVPLSITANKPVSVFQYGPGQAYDNKTSGDPYMALVPGLDQYQSSYNFACTPGFTCNIAITIAATYKTGLILDGIAFTNYAEVKVPSPYTAYTTVFKTVYGISHTLRHTSSEVTFGLLVYGLKKDASFGYPGGLKIIDPGV